jgi:hypothetical protein
MRLQREAGLGGSEEHRALHLRNSALPPVGNRIPPQFGDRTDSTANRPQSSASGSPTVRRSSWFIYSPVGVLLTQNPKTKPL